MQTMNDPFVPTPMAMTSLEGFASSGMMTAHDVSEDESEENNYGDVSKILHHLDKEQFSDDSFHLESNELSLSSLDFNLEDDSMEPTPIRPDGIPSVDPQNAFRAFLAPTISNNNTIFAPLNMFPYLPMTTTGKRDFSMMYMPSSTSRVHFDPRRSTVLSYSHDDDLNSCFIRPSKIARMVSSPSFSRAALDIQNRFGSIPEKRAMPSPTGGKAMCNITATAGFSIDDNSAPSGKRAMSLKDPAPKRPKSGDCSEEADEQSEEETGRFRVYQSDQWKERFADLQAYKKRFGNCVVPHNYLHNGSPALAQWVKRQRFQWKQRMNNKRSTISDERMELLSSIGFVFDSHLQSWEMKYASLVSFKKEHGHVGVPSKWHDKELAIWVKCQRRNYKLYCQGRKSAMTKERIALLEALDFDWNPRNL